MVPIGLFLIIFGLLAAPCRCMSDRNEQDDWLLDEQSGWVDPFSMGDLDRRQPLVVDNVQSISDNIVVEAKLLGVLSELVEGQKTILAALQTNNRTAPRKAGKLKSQPTVSCELDDVFIKRFVGRLVTRLNWLKQPTDGAHIYLELSLTQHQISTLVKFSQGEKVNIHDVDIILDVMMMGHSQFQPVPSVFSNTGSVVREALEGSRDLLMSICATLILGYLGVFAFRYFSVFKLGLLGALVSIVWHWLHMYKNAWAKKHAKLMQSLPSDCHAESVWQSVRSSIWASVSNADKCQEYHKAMMVDPVYEVNPLMAATNLASNLIFGPLVLFGEALGQTFSNLLDALPLAWKVPVLLIFVLLLVLSLVMLAGYRIRLPFFLGEIGPAARTAADKSELICLQAELREVRQLLLCQQEQRPRLPALSDHRQEGQRKMQPVKVMRQIERLSSGVEELHMKQVEPEQATERPEAVRMQHPASLLLEANGGPVAGELVVENACRLVSSPTVTDAVGHPLQKPGADSCPTTSSASAVHQGPEQLSMTQSFQLSQKIVKSQEEERDLYEDSWSEADSFEAVPDPTL